MERHTENAIGKQEQIYGLRILHYEYICYLKNNSNIFRFFYNH